VSDEPSISVSFVYLLRVGGTYAERRASPICNLIASGQSFDLRTMAYRVASVTINATSASKVMAPMPGFIVYSKAT
jgi:hypothetical protein